MRRLKMGEPYLIDKPLGATPLEALDFLRSVRPEIAEAKLSYAGRLDPMASGLLLALHGPLLARQEDFWHLPKRYDASILFGMYTDSYDTLGIPTPVSSVREISHSHVLAEVAQLVGKHRLPVPMFSGHKRGGRPLFAWARAQEDVGEIPTRVMAVIEVSVRGTHTMTAEKLRERLERVIPLVHGDFRQDAILSAWRNLLEMRHKAFSVVDLTIQCGAGTYIRSLAHILGQRLGIGGTLLSLRRTHVGQWSVDDPNVLHTSAIYS